MNANQIEKPNHRHTGVLPILAAAATLVPVLAGLAIATGQAGAVRPAVSFHCPNEHGNGTSANPLDDNGDHGLDAGDTAANTVTAACRPASTTVPITTTPVTSVPVTTVPATTATSAAPTTVATVDPTDPTVTTTPGTTTPGTTATTAPATTAPATTVTTTVTTTSSPATTAPTTVSSPTAPSPTVATLPQARTGASPTTAATATSTPSTSATTLPAVLRFGGPATPPVSTTRPGGPAGEPVDPSTIPVEIAPNAGVIVNPAAVQAFGVTRSAATIAPAATTAATAAPVATAAATATTRSVAAGGPGTVPTTVARFSGVFLPDTIGMTPPPVEVLGLSISNVAMESVAPTGLPGSLAFTGSSTGRLVTLAGAALSLGFGLVDLARRTRRARRG